MVELFDARAAYRFGIVAALLLAALFGVDAVRADTPAPHAFPQPFAPLDPYDQAAAMHRGINVLGWDPVWRDPAQARFKPSHFARIRDAGFDTVRVVLQGFPHMDESGALDPTWLATLDGMVDAALASRLTVILDLHDIGLCAEDIEACRSKLNAFWGQIAPRYQGTPNRLLFEILNEPHGKLMSAPWNALLREPLAIIRATNPTRNVVVGPAGWNGIEQLEKFDLPPDDQHIVVTVHYYAPMQFTHQGASWVKETMNLSDVRWGTEAERQKIVTDFDGVQAWSVAHHRPIFLGEFGAYERGDIESRMKWDSAIARAAEAHGFPWAYWQFDSDFIAFDMARDDWVQPILYALIPPHDSSRAASPAHAQAAAPVSLTAEQDHQRMLDLLHIGSLRPGVNGMDPRAPNAVNYDEVKANPNLHLPDPLKAKDGTPIVSAQMWWSRRRPEIVEDFDREVYGRMPAHTPPVRWTVVSNHNEMRGDTLVVTKELVGHVDNSSDPAIAVDIGLTLTTPARATRPVPVVMEFGFGALPPGFKLPPAPPGPDWRDQVLAKGWGFAVLRTTTVQADNGEGLTKGIIGLVNHGQPRKLDDWGALRAWAWGASRALDYFETDKAVDAKKIGVEGHSRFGKAALVAMAYDPRFAIAYISSSGEGGAALYRRGFGEALENVAATNEYHWMAGNFLKYAGPLTADDLPVDSHELIALCAPRPVFIGAGATNGDGWVDAKGMFLAAAAASPVYELLGAKGLQSSEFPPIETALIDGDLAFRQHSGGHTPAPNWPTFIDFAQRYLGQN